MTVMLGEVSGVEDDTSDDDNDTKLSNDGKEKEEDVFFGTPRTS